ncbi:hypothetical protein WH95_08900 [Kiloniella litopenaei]|uniref:[Ribosomal protein bS18]-alanine N-acetyltransferase n=1 Tax=Kiloniella litopenaei TaxID=1549748 RepID=A0A0M2RB17_9PROT|nr:ribosomal protein S18-alanine N-acetyltransferase [Kiloniella litopenaei]KKJ77170.1 hypothetical protein WH95_08900 [Kiloniella litopenaei]
MSDLPEVTFCGIEHVDLLAEMHSRSFAVSAWNAKDFLGLLIQKTNKGFIYCKNGHPVGFIIWQEVAGEAEILTFCVDPGSRGQGYSKKIISLLFEHLNQASVYKMFLEVSEDNMIALSLYRTMGFEEVARRSKYYHRPDGLSVDAVIMSVDI